MTKLIRWLCSFLSLVQLMLCTPGLLEAQRFTIAGSVPQGVTGMARITLYRTDMPPQVLNQRVKNGTFSLTGDVKHPTIASLTIGNNAPLYLWVENADIVIAYNPDQPSASRITGSRSNSEYRYALEVCAQDAVALSGNGFKGAALLRYASQHLASRYVPFLLWLYYQDDDYAALDSLCNRMTGEAAEAYHYPLLKRKVGAVRNSSEGCLIPDVTIPFGRIDNPGNSSAASQANAKVKRLEKHSNMVPLDSLISATTTFLLVSPSWLEQKKHHFDSLCAAIQCCEKTAQVVWAATDKAPQGWDELYMQLLNIQRLPYIILIDSQGRIVARDVRVWEAERLLHALPQKEVQAPKNAGPHAKHDSTKQPDINNQ